MKNVLALIRTYVTAVTLAFALASCGGGGGGGGIGGGTGGTGGTPVPDLAITAFTGLPSGGPVSSAYSVTVTVTNVGTAPAAGIGAEIMLSPTSNIVADGTMLNLGISMAILNPGQSTTITVPISSLPSNVPNGTYYMGAYVPYTGDANMANNVASQTFALSGGSTCTNDTYEPDNSAGAAHAITIGAPQAHNHCNGTADWVSFAATSGQTYTLSTSQVGLSGWTQIVLYDTDGVTPLATGGIGLDFSDSRLTWVAPKSGTFYASVVPMMGLYDAGPGTDYNMNLGDLRPDLIVTGLYSAGSGPVGGQISVWGTVRNQGFADVATTAKYDVAYYLSTTATFNAASAIYLGTQTFTGGLTVGSYSPYTTGTVTIPATTAVGSYYLFAVVNPTGTANPVNEYATVNNVSTGQPFSVISASCTDDSYEPDNAPAQAKPIVVGATPQAHNHCLDTTDWVSFSATAGTSYSIMALPVGGSANPTIQLYDTTGATVLLPAAGTTTNSITWTAPTTGTYYVLASDAMGAGTDYTLRVNLNLPDLTETFQTQTTTTVTAGDFLAVTDTVSNYGYTAAGAFNVGVYFSSSSAVTAASTLAATRNVASGVAASPGSPWPPSNQAWYSAHFAYTTTPGTYYIAAIADPTNAIAETDKTNNTSTPLPITVVAPPCAVDAYEDDDSIATAKAITAGTPQSRNNCDDSLDLVSFTPTASGAYVVSSVAPFGAFAPNITILQSDGVTPVTLKDSLPGFSNYASWMATAGTQYYIQLVPISSGLNTGYTLGVTQCTEDAYEPDDVYTAAQPITAGAAAQSHNHCEDGHDWVKFTAVANTKYTITGTNVGSAANVNVTLYDSNANIVAWGSSAQGGKLNVITWTAPATGGTYYIQATEAMAWGANTAYTLQLQ